MTQAMDTAEELPTVQWVLANSETKGGARAVLLAVAFCVDTGRDALSLSELTHKARLHPDTTKRIVRELHEGGHITRRIDGGPFGTNRYGVVTDHAEITRWRVKWERPIFYVSTARPRRHSLTAIMGDPQARGCAYCGNRAQAWDHVMPHSRGGKDEPSNLAPACASCNSSKGALTPEEWWQVQTGSSDGFPAAWPRTQVPA
jgi:5-methylcytosine-specific restriction endonuclease McrA